MNRLCSILLLAVLALPAQALASDPAVDVGVDLYRHGDYKGAVLALNKALKRGVADPSDRASARIYLASSYEARGQKEQARQTLTDLFRESPAVPIDSALFPPSFVKLADGVRKDVASSAPATPAPVETAQAPVTQPVSSAPASAPVAVAAPEAAAAGPSGFEGGLRLAFAVPGGSEVADSSLRDTTTGAFQGTLDLGWRINPNWFVGAYLEGGPATISSSVDCGGFSCSATEGSGGLQAQYHFNPLGTDPWVGLGLGYEILSGTFTQNLASIDISEGGPHLRLQGGVDWRLSRLFAIGPYAALSFGQFSSQSLGNVSVDVSNKGTHLWFNIGARTTFDF